MSPDWNKIWFPSQKESVNVKKCSNETELFLGCDASHRDTYDQGSWVGAKVGLPQFVCDPGEEVGHGAFTTAVELQTADIKSVFPVALREFSNSFNFIND